MERGVARSAFTALAVVVLAAVASAASAQTRVEETVDHALTGDVTVVDPVAGTVTVGDVSGQLTTLVVNDATTLLKDDVHIGIDDLVKGDRVVVEWDDRTGRNLATYLEVVEPAAPAARNELDPPAARRP